MYDVPPPTRSQVQRSVQCDDITCKNMLFHYNKAPETLKPRQYPCYTTYSGKVSPFACFRCLEWRAWWISQTPAPESVVTSYQTPLRPRSPALLVFCVEAHESFRGSFHESFHQSNGSFHENHGTAHAKINGSFHESCRESFHGSLLPRNLPRKHSWK